MQVLAALLLKGPRAGAHPCEFFEGVVLMSQAENRTCLTKSQQLGERSSTESAISVGMLFYDYFQNASACAL